MNSTISKLFAAILLLSGISAFAQDVKITWGPETKLSKNTEIDRIIGGNDNALFSLFYEYDGSMFSKQRVPVIAKSDKNFKVNFVKDIKFPTVNAKKTLFNDIRYFNGKMELFSSLLNKTGDKNLAYVNEVDIKGNTSKIVTEIEKISTEKSLDNGSFDYVLSNDTSKILIYHQQSSKKGEGAIFSYKVCDKNFKELWKKEVVMPYEPERFDVENYLVTDNGELYLLGKIYLEEKVGGKPNFTYVILYYDYKENKFLTYDISLDDKFISDITFKIDSKTDNLVCAGFFSNKKTLTAVGAFYLRIDSKTKKVVSKGVKGFDKGFLANFTSAENIKKGEGLSRFDLRNFFIKEDGSAVLIAEQYYILVAKSTASNGFASSSVSNIQKAEQEEDSRVAAHYYYNDIIVVNISADADIKWVSWIPKKQISTDEENYFSSFLLGVKDDKISIIYNDNKANTDIDDAKDMKPMKNPSAAVPMIVTINKDGDAVKKPLATDDADFVLCPKISLQKNNSEIYIYSKKGKYQKFGKLTFN
jgi:hypothetical protein